MRLLSSIIAVTLLFVGSTFALYQPTADDQQMVDDINTQLHDMVGNNKHEIRHFYVQLLALEDTFANDDRLAYLLNEVKQPLKTKLQAQKSFAKLSARDTKKDFLLQFDTGISNTGIVLPERCFTHYELLDDLAYVHDITTAAIIATRYRESTCGVYLPHNGDGPFQIVSKDYGTGEMTISAFVRTVEDFADFANYKHEWYENANSKSGLTVDLHYTGFDLTGVIRHGALYNGLSGYTVYGDAQPLWPNYVFDGYGEQFSGATRYGILPVFIKALERERENYYIINPAF